MVKDSFTNLSNRLLQKKAPLRRKFPLRHLHRPWKIQRKLKSQRRRTVNHLPCLVCEPTQSHYLRPHSQALQWVSESFKPHWLVQVTWPIQFLFTRILFHASFQRAVNLESSSHRSINIPPRYDSISMSLKLSVVWNLKPRWHVLLLRLSDTGEEEKAGGGGGVRTTLTLSPSPLRFFFSTRSLL